MPSAPCTTHARVVPSIINARARSSVNSGRGTPTSWRVAPAGFVNGPSRLNAVRTPSSRRTGAAWRIDGWNVGAKKKPMPASARHRSTTAGCAVMRIPRASYTSAPPVRLDAERLPCFATRTPAAATTMAAHDEILMVPDRSPPVPHVSNTSSYRFETLTACARIVRARPTISAGRSPFIARPISRPAMCAGAAWPSITSAIAAAASSVVRSSCRVSFSISVANMEINGPLSAIVNTSRSTQRPRRPQRRNDPGFLCVICELRVQGPAEAGHRVRSKQRPVETISAPSRQRPVEKIAQDVLALAGQNRFGMKLHAMNRPRAVAQPHDVGVLARARGHFELGWQPFLCHDQRVVPRGDERSGNAAEEAAAVVLDRRRLAVHRDAGAHDLAAEYGADRLMAQAHAQNRRRVAELPNDAHRHARLLRPARPGRDHNAIGPGVHHVFERDGVVPHHLHHGAQLAQVLHEVVGEGIVVVDH